MVVTGGKEVGGSLDGGGGTYCPGVKPAGGTAP